MEQKNTITSNFNPYLFPSYVIHIFFAPHSLVERNLKFNLPFSEQ